MNYKVIKFNHTFDKNYFGRLVEGQPIYEHSNYEKIWNVAKDSIKKVPEMSVICKKIDTVWIPTHRFCSMYENGKVICKPYKIH